MRGKSKKERAQGRIHSFKGHRKGELGKEILLMIAAGLAIPAAFLMPNIPIALKPLLRALTKSCGLRKGELFVRSTSYLMKALGQVYFVSIPSLFRMILLVSPPSLRSFRSPCW